MFWCDSTRLNINGAGQWLDEKLGAKSRDGWRKLHLAFDADSGKIIAHSLTVQEISDASQLEPLLDQIDDEIGQFTADGTHDSYPNYDAVLGSSAGAKVFVNAGANMCQLAGVKMHQIRHCEGPPIGALRKGVAVSG